MGRSLDRALSTELYRDEKSGRFLARPQPPKSPAFFVPVQRRYNRRIPLVRILKMTPHIGVHLLWGMHTPCIPPDSIQHLVLACDPPAYAGCLLCRTCHIVKVRERECSQVNLWSLPAAAEEMRLLQKCFFSEWFVVFYWVHLMMYEMSFLIRSA